MYTELELKEGVVTSLLINNNLEALLNKLIEENNPIVEKMVDEIIKKNGKCGYTDFNVELKIEIKIKGDNINENK